MNKRLWVPVVGAVVLGFGQTLAANSEQQSHLEDQKSLSVTIYNTDLAVVKDQRRISLKEGTNTIAFRGVSAKIQPETALIKALNSQQASLRVIEQNFDYDLLTPAKLLDKYLGKEITLVTSNPATGEESSEQATVLSTQKGVVLQIGNRIETNPPGRFIFSDVPENLRDLPTLVTSLHNSAVSGPTDIELSYLSRGISWKADYVAELSADDASLDLQGWVTLDNRSGTAYRNAKLQLVAGDVNRVADYDKPMFHVGFAAAESSAAPKMVQESLFEYHLYSLEGQTNIENQQTKQVSLLTASSVPVQKTYLLRGNGHLFRSRNTAAEIKQSVEVLVGFENLKESGLGLPIPKGILRVYKNDSNGQAQFIGEDSIQHTAELDKVELKLGNAFDVTAKRRQTLFRKLPSGSYNSAFQTGHEITLSNAKDQAVVVSVRESLAGDWVIREESVMHEKLASHLVQWNVELQPKETVTLSYMVESRY